MKDILLESLLLNADLLPGEMGMITAIMVVKYEFNLIHLLCWLGGFLTINFLMALTVGGQRSESEDDE